MIGQVLAADNDTSREILRTLGAPPHQAAAKTMIFMHDSGVMHEVLKFKTNCGPFDFHWYRLEAKQQKKLTHIELPRRVNERAFAALTAGSSCESKPSYQIFGTFLLAEVLLAAALTSYNEPKKRTSMLS